jgi:hypothetical protein
MIQKLAACCGLVLLGATSASAQRLVWRDQIFVNANVGSQSKSQDYGTSFDFALFDEPGSVDLARTVKGGRFIDVTAGVTPLGRLGLAFNFMRRSGDSDGALTASLPDPIFYDRSQTLAGAVTALQHRESWLGLLIAYRLPAGPSDRINVLVMAGPVVARVRHEVVTDVAVDAGSGQVSASLSTLSRDLLGAQVGVDVSYQVVRHLGAGATVRYNRAKGNLGPDLAVDLGGVQFGVGLRMRF